MNSKPKRHDTTWEKVQNHASITRKTEHKQHTHNPKHAQRRVGENNGGKVSTLVIGMQRYGLLEML